MGLQREYLSILMESLGHLAYLSFFFFFFPSCERGITQEFILMPEKPKPTFYLFTVFHIKGTHRFFHANAVGIASPRTGKQPGCIA